MSWTIWITGRPGSGKTTVAREAALALRQRGIRVHVLELMAARKALLGGRLETEHECDLLYRALAFTAMSLTDAGVPVIVDATAPRRVWRDWARSLIQHFGEVQLVCSPEVCVAREQEGRWRRASVEAAFAATLPETAPDYEPSLRADLTLDTEAHQVWTVVEAVVRLAEHLERTAEHSHR